MNKYIILCDVCGTKKIIKNPDEVKALQEVNLASVPGGIPYIDPETKKVVIKQNQERCKVFKCSTCGRGVRVKKILTPESVHDPIPKEKNEEKIIDTGSETGTT